MLIIPAIDLINGRSVRLKMGNFAEKTEYACDPLTTAQELEQAGFTRLHLVDLDGARGSSLQNLAVLELISAKTTLQVDYSGGLRETEHVQAAFDSGALYVCIGSAAVRAEQKVEEWIRRFGAERFILGADVRGEHIAIAGWAEDTSILIVDFIRSWSVRGVQTFLVTAIEKDGLLQGPDFALYSKLYACFPEHDFIVSGGVSSLEDLERLRTILVKSVILGKALHEKRLSLTEVIAFSQSGGGAC